MIRKFLPAPQKILLLAVAFVLGLFLIIQARSFERVTTIATRDAVSNIFREIHILSSTNHQLRQEIQDLEEVIQETKNRSTSLQALEKEIDRNRLLDGSAPISGPGIVVSLPAEVTTPWLVDFVNELLGVGAQAFSLNGIRLTHQTLGFDVLPQGQILFNGTVIQPPYVFQVIGDPEILNLALTQGGGFIQRFEKFYKGKTLQVSKNNKILIQKIF